VTPRRAVLHHPVQQGPFKTDILAHFFTLDPLVTQDFIPLGKKFTVDRGIFEQITSIHRSAGSSHGYMVRFQANRVNHSLVLNLFKSGSGTPLIGQ